MPENTSERTEEQQRAYDVGAERGWDHANYVDAYGEEEKPAPGEPGPRRRMCPSWILNRRYPTPPLLPHYNKGWDAGVRRFKSGRYADGTKVPD